MTSSPDGSQPHPLDLDQVSRLCRICGLHPKSKLHNHTPVPEFDEGQSVSELEDQIRSEAVRAVLADIDVLLMQHEETALNESAWWIGQDGGDNIAWSWNLLRLKLQEIRREIAELGE